MYDLYIYIVLHKYSQCNVTALYIIYINKYIYV